MQYWASMIYENKSKKEIDQALLPIPADKRLYGRLTFTWMMFSMNVCIPLFFLGSIGYSLGLNALEIALGAFLGNLATAIVLLLNGLPGVKYGIPYPIQLRASWGSRGALIPVVLRGIVGAGWYGIEVYNGSLAMLMVALYILSYGGRNPETIVSASFKYVVIVVALYVVFATVIMAKGLKTVARFINLTGPMLLLYFIWLTIYLSGYTSSPMAPAGKGIFSKEFAVYLAVQTNFWATMCLNISDLARGLYADRRGVEALLIGPMIGIVLTSVVASLLGYYMVLFTGYSTPQEIILYTAPGMISIILGQVFAFIAPFSTDITANIPALMNIFTAGFKLKWGIAAAIAGVIGFVLAPWWAVERGPDIVNYVAAFTANYGIILGPIAGIMLSDYYIVKKRNYDVEKLYSDDNDDIRHHRYSYAAIMSYVISIVIIYVFSYVIGDIVKLGPLVFPTNLSWYLGVMVTFILYPIMVKVFKEG
ncbi:MAG: cytosine permease [Desulfurococcaceae archaeon]